MNAKTECPLTPALLALMQTALELGTAKQDALATALCLSPHTIHSEFHRIAGILDTRSCTDSFIRAFNGGWLRPCPDAGQAKGVTELAGCPLTPALLGLMQAAVDLGTANEETLGAALRRSPHTTHNKFRRICELLDASSRTDAFIRAFNSGWLPPRVAPLLSEETRLT